MSALSANTTRARAIALYLPQFHQIPENDLWWGEGFTEWTNVKRAKPLFPGHRQPVVPGALGYYDLADPAVAEAQADLARSHGIEGFCYWHYWFGEGRRILEMPFDRMLASGSPDFPFSLCWANQTWSGIWHGAPNKVLLEQKYPGLDDLKAHFKILARAFADPRYITVDGKPFFMIYSPASLPDPMAFVEQFREQAIAHGFPGVHLVGMSNNPLNPAFAGFDRIAAFGPGEFIDPRPLSYPARVMRRIAAAPKASILGGRIRKALSAPINAEFADVVDAAFEMMPVEERYIPCVLTGWDNTPRSKHRGVVFENMTPELLAKYVRKALDRVKDVPADRRIVLFKAWNEWAEGNVLEPTAADGTAYLEAVRDALLEKVPA